MTKKENQVFQEFKNSALTEYMLVASLVDYDKSVEFGKLSLLMDLEKALESIE